MPIFITTPLNIVTINNDVLKGLSDENHAAVMAAAKEVYEHQWSIIDARVKSNAKKAEAEGVIIVDGMDPALLDHLHNNAEPAVAGWLENIGKRGKDLVAEYKSKIK